MKLWKKRDLERAAEKPAQPADEPKLEVSTTHRWMPLADDEYAGAGMYKCRACGAHSLSYGAYASCQRADEPKFKRQLIQCPPNCPYPNHGHKVEAQEFETVPDDMYNLDDCDCGDFDGHPGDCMMFEKARERMRNR